MAKKPVSSTTKKSKKELSRIEQNETPLHLRTGPVWEDMSRPIHQIVPVVFFALAVFLLICFCGGGALVGDLLRTLFFGLFGRFTSTILLTVSCIFTCFVWRRKVRTHTLTSHFVSILLLLCLCACMVYAVCNSNKKRSWPSVKALSSGIQRV